MKNGFRQSMAWLHTWSGLLVGWILFAIFLTGTAAYYRDEISRWMRPELHAGSAITPAEATAAAVTFLRKRAPDSTSWIIGLPSAREPVLTLYWHDPAVRRFASAVVDPATGKQISARDTMGGEFFYRFHFQLHMPPVWGRWIVGFCAMFMLVAIISGVITHKRIFKDFFTFRPGKAPLRSWLDAHNATAVLGLPYHLVMTYSGLVTLMFMYMPWGISAAYPQGSDDFFSQSLGTPVSVEASHQPAALGDVAAMVASAAKAWNGAPITRVNVQHPTDAAGRVEVIEGSGNRLNLDGRSMTFASSDGHLIHASQGQTHAGAARGVMYGMHVGRFAGPLLRVFLFLCGLAGSVMVASGLVLWAIKEKQKHIKTGSHFGLRLVDALNIGAITGLLIAMGAFFLANRIIPASYAGRSHAEIYVFFAAWATAVLAAFVKPSRKMWQLQMGVAGLMFASLVVVNALTGDASLVQSITARDWPMAGFDVVTFLLGLLFVWTSYRIGHWTPPVPRRNARAEVTA
ncbi:putative iron-regulated membrane protein [Luteibacter sp. Sphag1AF]|uniref:PepSY-associated TM helix domain-containing protein n=1 Tax=Luteibacter sp. Sphag1AF TaxID=2587031 RepID=UPI001618A712|nr:PepSY-associated TM helix domain-containing protein [Luteibacter sp. Sphag1AF]MBB3228081.1 putative iron-regulated membrane protein [Luteibacter sp. Sphag1AF]